MYKQCQTEQSAMRQRELEQGLLNAMLKKRYEEISVSDLCEELGIPRKSFYRYFSSRDGALYALIDHTLLEFDNSFGAETTVQRDVAIGYMSQVFAYWIEHRRLLDALEKNNLSGILVQRAIVYSQKYDRLPAFMVTKDRQVQDYGTMFAVCGLMSMLIQWHHDGYVQSVEQMARLAVRLFSEPLFENIIDA